MPAEPPPPDEEKKMNVNQALTAITACSRDEDRRAARSVIIDELIRLGWLPEWWEGKP
jgi:hypothetical protein